MCEGEVQKGNRGCWLSYSFDWRGFVGTKKKTSLGLLLLFPDGEVSHIRLIPEKGGDDINS
jgi:hypothetical protein